jgi:hypothetical protein
LPGIPVARVREMGSHTVFAYRFADDYEYDVDRRWGT